MTDGGQMHTDLMSSPRFEVDAYEGSGRRWSNRIDMRDRMFAPFADAEGNRSDAFERRVNRLLLRELAFAQREVTLPDPLLFELPRELRVDVRALREKDHTARSAIEPLHQKEW